MKSKDTDPSDNIYDRKGILILSREMIINANENLLRDIFSNFFPIATETSHRVNFYDSITYYGLSPHFEKVKDGCTIPRYKMELIKLNEDGEFVFNNMIKID